MNLLANKSRLNLCHMSPKDLLWWNLYLLSSTPMPMVCSRMSSPNATEALTVPWWTEAMTWEWCCSRLLPASMLPTAYKRTPDPRSDWNCIIHNSLIQLFLLSSKFLQNYENLFGEWALCSGELKTTKSQHVTKTVH